jgi:hypothetical protein
MQEALNSWSGAQEFKGLVKNIWSSEYAGRGIHFL